MKTLSSILIAALSLAMASCTKEDISELPTPSQINSNRMQQSFTDVRMEGIYGYWMETGDSICAPIATGQTITGQRSSNSNGSCTYVFTGNSSDCSFSFKFVDINGGLISSGDYIGVAYNQYTIYSGTFSLDQAAYYAQVNVSNNVVTLEYAACVVPFNGTEGAIKVQFYQ